MDPSFYVIFRCLGVHLSSCGLGCLSTGTEDFLFSYIYCIHIAFLFLSNTEHNFIFVSTINLALIIEYHHFLFRVARVVGLPIELIKLSDFQVSTDLRVSSSLPRGIFYDIVNQYMNM
jgi:hypothetical protein